MFTHHSLLTPGRIPGWAPGGKFIVYPPQYSSSKHDGPECIQSASALARSNSFISFLTTSLKALSPPLPYASISSPYPLFSFLSNSTCLNHLNLFIFRTLQFAYVPILSTCFTSFLFSQKGTTHPPFKFLSSPALIHASSSLAMSHFHTSRIFGHRSYILFLSVWATILWKSRWETTLWTFSMHILTLATKSAPSSAFSISPSGPSNKTVPFFPEYLSPFQWHVQISVLLPTLFTMMYMYKSVYYLIITLFTMMILLMIYNISIDQLIVVAGNLFVNF